jgi:hypothetical protein
MAMEKKMSDINSWSSALAIIFTAIVGAGAYWYQKWLDRKASLVELRRAKYVEYLNALIGISGKTTSDALMNYNRARAALIVCASDSVVVCVGKFNNFMTSTPSSNRNPDQYKDLLTELVMQMRRDCFEKSKLDYSEFNKMLPVE